MADYTDFINKALEGKAGKKKYDPSDPSNFIKKGGPEEPREFKNKKSVDYTSFINNVLEDKPEKSFREDAPRVESGFVDDPSVIDARTGLPRQTFKFNPESAEGADISTHANAGLVDDPKIKMSIYAKARFPNDPEAIKRYGMVDGEIFYMGEDGNLHKETPDKMGDSLKRMAGTQIANAPGEILGTVGALAGPGTAALGYAGGEGIRKSLGALVHGEQQSTLGNVKDMAVAGGMGYLSGKMGDSGVGTIDKIRGKDAARLVKAAGRGRERIDLDDVKRMKQMADEVGVSLIPPQTTKSPELISRFNILKDLPETSDKAGQLIEKQKGEVFDAVKKYMDSLGSPETSPMSAGKEVSKLAKDHINRIKKVRTKAAKPYYDEAKEVVGIDISPTMKKLTAMLDEAPRGSKEQGAIRKIKTMLTREVKDQLGNKFLVPEDRLKLLDKVKKTINSQWKKNPKNAPEIDIQNDLNEVLKSMLDVADQVSPEYKKGRSVFQKLSPSVEKYTKGTIGELSKLEGEAVEKASQKLFSPAKSSPETVRTAKTAIIQQPGGEEAWNNLLRVHINDALDKVKKTNTPNIGGQLSKKLFGDPQQKRIIKEAMSHRPDLYQNFEKLMEVFDRTGLILGKESTTATRQVQLKQMHREAESRLITAMTRPLQTPKQLIGDKINETLFQKRNIDLLNAMTSEKAADQLNKLLELKPNSIKLIRGLATFLGGSAGMQARGELQRRTSKDIPKGKYSSKDIPKGEDYKSLGSLGKGVLY